MSSITEQLKKLLPGFGGYASLEQRRSDDRMAREYLILRLQNAKESLEKIVQPAVASVDFDTVTKGEKLRDKIELAANKVRAAVEGYASWFSDRSVSEELLKKVADADGDLIGVADRLNSLMETPELDWDLATETIDLFSQRFERRREMLSSGD